MGNRAANNAAQLQAQAAREAADNVGVAVSDANRGVSEATSTATKLALDKGQNVVDAGARAAEGMSGAVTSANAMLDPYAATGATAAQQLQNRISQNNGIPTLDQLQLDPGYDFRLQQGELALERSAAAKGAAMGGAAMKDLTTFAQGTASQEYQKAFDRYQQSTSNLLNISNSGQAAATHQGGNLIGGAQYGGDITTDAAKTNLSAGEFAAQAGMQGAGQQSNNLMEGARTAADLTTGGANARAAGIVGGTNALTAGIAGVGDAAGGAITMANLLRNPATTPLNNLPMRGNRINPLAFVPGGILPGGRA